MIVVPGGASRRINMALLDLKTYKLTEMLPQILNKSNLRPILLIICIIIPLTYFLFERHASTLSQQRTDVARLTEQRNTLSRKLNLANKALGKCQCEIEDMKSAGTDGAAGEIAASGGWCQTFAGEGSREHITDEGLARGLSKFLQGDTVASFGDGPGRYAKIISELKDVKRYDAYDGSPYAEEATNDSVRHLDLSIPQFGFPLYDWILSLEVAEHIPQEFEHVYLDNIWRHARLGVIISWAIPGQYGFHHVNNKEPQWLLQEFRANGFDVDNNGTAFVRKAASVNWLTGNIHVFRRRYVDANLEANA